MFRDINGNTSSRAYKNESFLVSYDLPEREDAYLLD
jgi:hypothetical protein